MLPDKRHDWSSRYAGLARRLGENAAEQRSTAAGAFGQNAQRVEHAVDIERRRLDRHKQEIGRGEAIERGLGPETRRVDDDKAAASGEPPRGRRRFLAGVL